MVQSRNREVVECADIGDRERRRVERCFEVHHPAVFRYALRRVADPATAEDVTAEVFAVVWSKRDRIPDQPLPWLYGVARNVISNQRRSERRSARLQAALKAQPGPGGATSATPSVDDRDRLRTALRTLSVRDRELLMLLAWEGLDQAEAAVALGCTKGALRVRLLRARRRFERALNAADADPSAAAPEPAEVIE